jgi:trk system potassium uptake protein TrkA
VVKIRSGAFPAGKQLRNLMEYHSRFHVSAIRRGREFIIPRGDDYLLENDILYFTVLPGHVDDLISFCGKRKERIRRLLILGASRTALRLVKLLEGSDFRVTIIDSSRDRCREVAAKCDATIVNADARDLRLLQEEGIREADAFVALTGSSETNIVSCMIAREFGVKKTIAEIEDIEYMAEAERLNIDTIVNKKLASSSAVVQMILDSDLSSPRCLVLPDAEVAEIVARPNSRITSEKVRNLKLSKEMTIAGLTRNDVGMLVDGETRICDGDHVVVFCKQGALRKVERLFN